ncbi:unnamed protein product [Eruca vesicaria subsp. sativa]|uniref:1-phosphatidylinositol 4-kinase n=1 Tax=Eruca vesicaria subsp. sativa TaxID=29727 RepID=A0ABC8KWT2_ERUVS|nr:unnamed protein product [Eruca vesicaria subsp. sativa]
MGKNSGEEQNLPSRSDGGGDTVRNNNEGCSARICRCFSIRCVLILAFSAALFLSAVFWLPPFLGLSDPQDLDLDPRFKDHRIVASFDVEKPVPFLKDNLLQLENDITDEISVPMIKVNHSLSNFHGLYCIHPLIILVLFLSQVVVLALERLKNLNRTMVIFAIDPEKKNSKIPSEIESLIKAAFVTLVEKQMSFRLTESLFGQPFLFEVLKFPGGITVIPSHPVFPLQNAQLLFNFTLNFSIYQIQANFEELTSQLKKGINLAPYENLYITLSNSRGSTVAPPTIVHSSVLLTFGISSRLKQLSQTITGSRSKNLGLNHTVFGKVKQVRLSSVLPHSPVQSLPPSPSPSPQPETHHHHHHHRHHHHHHELAPEPSPAAKSFAPASAPTKHLHLHRRSPPPCPYEQRRPKGNNALNHHTAAPTPAPHRSKQHTPAPNRSKQHASAPNPTPPSHHHHAIPVSSPLPHVVFAHIPPPARNTPESGPVSEKTPAPSPTPSSASMGPTFKRASTKLLVIVAVCRFSDALFVQSFFVLSLNAFTCIQETCGDLQLKERGIIKSAIINLRNTGMNCMALALDPLTDRFTHLNRSSQRCRLQSLTNLDFNFLNFNTKPTTLTSSHSFNHRSVSSPCFSITSKNQDASPKIEIIGGQRVPTIRSLVAEVTIAMASGAQPLLLPSGLGGAYLLQTGQGHSIAVAKPVDEEPLAFNNPKGSGGGLMLGQPGLKRSIRVGESGIREVAAYLLDHQGFSSVPPTALVRISHVPFHGNEAADKVASLQRYVGHDFDAGELGPGSFTVGSVHRIGILDVRVLNLDRHAGNMLVKKVHDQDGVGAGELVPIDHGLCLPECLDDPYFEWLNWPQASVPFTDAELQYISNLDPFKDAELLRTELGSIQESSIRVLIVCTMFLKQAAASGLCLAEIGEKMTRDICRGEESSSFLEILCTKAKENVVGGSYQEEDGDDDYSSEWDEVEAEIECCIFNFDDEFEDKKCKEMSQVSPRAPSFSANLSALMMSSWISTHDRSLVRSKSHPVCVNQDDTEGVYFGDMSAEEWEMFLQMFQVLLPEALEGSTSKGPKPRFGSSCKF